MLTPRRFTDEEEAFHARSDYFNLEGARGEPAGRRVDLSAWCGREHDLSLEVEAWRHGIVRCQAVSRSQARERQTQEAVGRGGAEGAEIAAVAQWYACCLADLSRSLAWPRLKGRDDTELRHRLKVLAGRYPHMAIRSVLHGILKHEGFVINRKRTYRSTARKTYSCMSSAARRSRGPRCRCRSLLGATSVGLRTSCPIHSPMARGSMLSTLSTTLPDSVLARSSTCRSSVPA